MASFPLLAGNHHRLIFFAILAVFLISLLFLLSTTTPVTRLSSFSPDLRLSSLPPSLPLPPPNPIHHPSIPPNPIPHASVPPNPIPHASVPPNSPPLLPLTPPPLNSSDIDEKEAPFEFSWELCRGGRDFKAVDYIPCLDNWKEIWKLKSRKRMEHRERYCPQPSPQCLVPMPVGYRTHVPWPESRDMIWYKNVPRTKLVEYKKDQNWVKISGEYLIFPGGGTQFKRGVNRYIQFIEKILPTVGWGSHTRVIMDVGCGVASFGGYLLDKDVLTMSFAPKDEHEAQIQFALERGIPSFLAVIGIRRLSFPDNVFDMIHCARCRVHWDGDGGKPLLELNRILRPGGFFVWSATPVYRDGEKDQSTWNAMKTLTASICWKMVVKDTDELGIGIVVYQKPHSNLCYDQRGEKRPPLCDDKNRSKISWYVPLDGCLPRIPNVNSEHELNWPTSWPDRLKTVPLSHTEELKGSFSDEKFYDDMKHWEKVVSEVYLHRLGLNWSGIRNVMDMNAGFGGFAAALVNQPLWVMNTVPVHGPDTLPIIFDRGLIGIYHDWCEAFNTYPRTYDLLHSSFLFGNLDDRCDIVGVVAEMDRILRPGGWVLIQDKFEILKRMRPILQSLHWDIALHEQKYLVGQKSFWRPGSK